MPIKRIEIDTETDYFDLIDRVAQALAADDGESFEAVPGRIDRPNALPSVVRQCYQAKAKIAVDIVMAEFSIGVRAK